MTIKFVRTEEYCDRAKSLNQLALSLPISAKQDKEIADPINALAEQAEDDAYRQGRTGK